MKPEALGGMRMYNSLSVNVMKGFCGLMAPFCAKLKEEGASVFDHVFLKIATNNLRG